MYDMEMAGEIYYGESAQYMNRYVWRIADHLPKSVAELWTMFPGKKRNTTTPAISEIPPSIKHKN